MATSLYKCQTPQRPHDQATCIHHKGKQLDFYCRQCQEPVCSKCMSPCITVILCVNSANIILRRNKKSKHLLTENLDILQADEYITVADTSLKENANNFKQLANQFKEQIEKLKGELDLLSVQTLSHYQKMEDDNVKLLTAYKQDLEAYRKELQQKVKDSRILLDHSSDIEIYDSTCDLSAPATIPVKPVLANASFHPNHNPKSQLEQALGKVNTPSRSQRRMSGRKVSMEEERPSPHQPEQDDTAPSHQPEQEDAASSQQPEQEDTGPPPQQKQEDRAPPYQPEQEDTMPSHKQEQEDVAPSQQPEQEDTTPSHQPEQDYGAPPSQPEPNERTPNPQPESDTDRKAKHRQSTEKEEKVASSVYSLLPHTWVQDEWMSLCSIGSLCATADGQMWTSFYPGDTLTLLNRDGHVVQEVRHSTGIRDISMSPADNTLWACDMRGDILELSSERLEIRFSIWSEPQSICITASRHIIVGAENKISKYTRSGDLEVGTDLEESWDLVAMPLKLYACPVSMNIAAADDRRAVVVMNGELQKLFVYTGEIPGIYSGPFMPWAVVYDSIGNLVIGDYSNNRILLIGRLGEFIRIIYIDEDWPGTLCVDSEGVLWSVFGSGTTKLLK